MAMGSKLFICICSSYLFFAVAFPVFAVTISVSTPSASISSDIFNVDVSISGATNATNYLRVDLFKDGTNKYFGETYNGSDWYSGSEGKNYFPIQIQNSTASATIKAQLGNPSSDEYPGPGMYKLKIRRYTSSGSQSSNDSQTPADIQITYTLPTPTPTPTPTTTPTPSATPLGASPTPTPKPTPSPKPTPTPTPTPTPKPSPSPVPLPTTYYPSPSPSPQILGTTTPKKPFWEIISIIFGSMLLGLSVIWYIIKIWQGEGVHQNLN